jgi:hypothetical protein
VLHGVTDSVLSACSCCSQALHFGAPYLCATAVLPLAPPLSHAGDPLSVHFATQGPAAWRDAVACGAARVPLPVLEAAIACGAARLFEAGSSRVGAGAAGSSPGCPAYLAHTAARVPGLCSVGTFELLLTAEQRFPRCIRVPDAAVSLAAAVLDGGSWALSVASCGLVSLEPFVSLAGELLHAAPPARTLSHTAADPAWCCRSL